MKKDKILETILDHIKVELFSELNIYALLKNNADKLSLEDLKSLFISGKDLEEKFNEAISKYNDLLKIQTEAMIKEKQWKDSQKSSLQDMKKTLPEQSAKVLDLN